MTRCPVRWVVGMLLAGSCALGQSAGQPPTPAPKNPPATYPGYFAKLRQQSEEQQKTAAERQAKLRELAKKFIAARGGDGKDSPGGQMTTFRDLNARLPKPDAAPKSTATATGLETGIKPGERVDVIMREGNQVYSGTFVGVDGNNVLVQTIPLPDAKPSTFALADITAFHTADGVFAFDPRSREFVPALTWYRLDRASGEFVRNTAKSPDSFTAKSAKLLGPASSAYALIDVAADGSMSVGLPIPVRDSPAAVPASAIHEIVTDLGVYKYDAASKGFTYETHVAIADAANKATNAEMQANLQKEWERRMTEYQIKHPPVPTLNSYYSTYWAGSRPWPWWHPVYQNRPPQ